MYIMLYCLLFEESGTGSMTSLHNQHSPITCFSRQYKIMAEGGGPPELKTQKTEISELINTTLVKGDTW